MPRDTYTRARRTVIAKGVTCLQVLSVYKTRRVRVPTNANPRLFCAHDSPLPCVSACHLCVQPCDVVIDPYLRVAQPISGPGPCSVCRPRHDRSPLAGQPRRARAAQPSQLGLLESYATLTPRQRGQRFATSQPYLCAGVSC